jgi:hypothetical protein
MKVAYLVGFGLAAVSAAMSAPAVASPTSPYIFTTSDGSQPSNVGTITLTQVDADDVTIDLTLKSGYGILNTGGPHTPFAFDVSGALSGLTAVFVTPQTPADASEFTLDTGGGSDTPYGDFTVGVDYSGGNGSGKAYYGDLQITLTRSTGLDTADFLPNGNGYYFSADLTNGSNTGSQAWAIELPRKTPEPATVALLGAGLVAGAAMRRRLRAKA